MKLQGQQSGYAMAVLLVGMSIMALMMTAALPTWKQMSRREKESELVFRGEQYARAIALFQLKAGPGTLPPSIDVLVEQKFLRKKFKDPITNDDFVPLVQAVGAAAGTTTPGGRQGVASAQPGTGGTGQRGETNVAQPQGQPGAAVGSTPGQAAAAGITGVTSKSKEQSIRLYKGRGHYNEWQFLPVARTAAPGAPGAGAPGQPAGGPGGARGSQGNPQRPNPFNSPNNPQPGGRGPGSQPFNPFQGQQPGR